MVKTLIREKIFQTGIRKVIKQVHPDLMISATAITKLSEVLYTVTQDLIGNSVNVMCNNRLTIQSKDMVKSAKVTLVGELSKHAVHEGTKYVIKYNSFLDNRRSGSKKMSIGKRINLSFQPSLMENLIRDIGEEHKSNIRVSKNTSVFLAGVIEYLTAEVIELTGNLVKKSGKSKITPSDLEKAIAEDEELNVNFRCKSSVKF